MATGAPTRCQVQITYHQWYRLDDEMRQYGCRNMAHRLEQILSLYPAGRRLTSDDVVAFYHAFGFRHFPGYDSVRLSRATTALVDELIERQSRFLRPASRTIMVAFVLLWAEPQILPPPPARRNV